MDFKAEREKRGLSTEDVARALDVGVSTINGLEKHDKGGKRLRRDLERFYGKENSEMEFRETAPESDLQLWRRRAKSAEKTIARLQIGLRGLLEISSGEKAEFETVVDILHEGGAPAPPADQSSENAPPATRSSPVSKYPRKKHP